MAYQCFFRLNRVSINQLIFQKINQVGLGYDQRLPGSGFHRRKRSEVRRAGQFSNLSDSPSVVDRGQKKKKLHNSSSGPDIFFKNPIIREPALFDSIPLPAAPPPRVDFRQTECSNLLTVSPGVKEAR